MRLWSLHPTYLDSKGIVACWREALLAQSVLMGKTKGYKNHPQLERFKKTDTPIEYMGDYLFSLWLESKTRNYNFDITKIFKYDLSGGVRCPRIKVTNKQLCYEFYHLQNKLRDRDLNMYGYNFNRKYIDCIIKPHPMFEVVKGEIESWEKVKS